jgi:hypothetical protein
MKLKEYTMKKTNMISAVIYLGAAVLLSGIFLLGTFGGNFTALDRIGGAIWVFILSTIIFMPIVITAVKKRMNI